MCELRCRWRRGSVPCEAGTRSIGVMSQILVRGGGALDGTVRVSGATKNEGTKIMAAALLARGTSSITNIPPVSDLAVMIELLEIGRAHV